MHPVKVFSIIASILLTSCGTDDSAVVAPVNTACPAKAAQILVHDNFLEAPCGCAESPTAPIEQNSQLRCTLAPGSTVFFQFVGDTSTHQIISVGDQTFSPSPFIEPERDDAVRSHAVVLGEVGTYLFRDVQNSSLSGAIVIR